MKYTNRAKPHGRGRCALCDDLNRTQIELLLAGGAHVSAVARKYEKPYWLVRRHWQQHISPERKANLILGPVTRQAIAARVAEESSSVIDQLRVIRAGLFQTYDAALTAGDRLSVASIAGKLHENLRVVGGITGELANSPLVQVNQQNNYFINDPSFARFQADLIRVLAPYAAARAAVIREFEQIEAAAARPALEHSSNDQAA